jgi:Kef-type K+ transport system membrane component KefB
MVPRGEVGLIIASIGQSRGVLPDEVFSAVVIMSIVTTLFAPPLLKLLYRGWSPGDAVPGPSAEGPAEVGPAEPAQA